MKKYLNFIELTILEPLLNFALHILYDNQNSKELISIFTEIEKLNSMV